MQREVDKLRKLKLTTTEEQYRNMQIGSLSPVQNYNHLKMNSANPMSISTCDSKNVS